MEQLFNNPGLIHIGEMIFEQLNNNGLESCSNVCLDWKKMLDNPRTWLNICVKRAPKFNEISEHLKPIHFNRQVDLPTVTNSTNSYQHWGFCSAVITVGNSTSRFTNSCTYFSVIPTMNEYQRIRIRNQKMHTNSKWIFRSATEIRYALLRC